MLFTLRNLGRLEEATIDLGKDLIVLTGPNNTSKTYVAHAIYGFCRYLVSTLEQAVQSRLLPTVQGADDKNKIEIDLLDGVDKELESIRTLVASHYTAKLPEVLRAPQWFTSSTKVELLHRANEIEQGKSLLRDQTLRAPELREQIVIEKAHGSGTLAAARVLPALETRSSQQQTQQALHNFLVVHTTLALARAFFGGMTEPCILPAERSAVEIFSYELAAQRFGPRKEDEALPSYPLPIAENLSSVIRRQGVKEDTSRYAAEADRLEREILQGNIGIGVHGDLLFTPTGATTQLDKYLSSSSVKSLAGLSFWLRHLAQRGDFLIIDEPELNLHPKNQRLVARLLARLARSGIKVMMSTHSDYILRELNNLIMLSRDKDGELHRKHGYGEDETLRPEQVGAYAFDGAHGRPIAIGPAGMDVEAIDKENQDLNRSSRDIYFTLEDREGA